MPTTTTGYATNFITFSRASNATVTDNNGYIKWAAHNLLTNSESFDASAWTKTQILSTTANATAAPDGTTTADLIIPNTTSAIHQVLQSASATNGASYTMGIFIKPNGYSKFALIEGENTGYFVSYNATGSGSVLDSSNATGTITALANGWYYATHRSVSGGTAFRLQLIILPASYTSGSVTGSWSPDGTSGLYLWGAALYRSDLGGMVANTSAYPYYNPTTPKNLLGYTEDFSNAAWTAVTNATVVTNGAIGPNGLQTADLVYPTTSGSNRQRYQTVAGQVSGTRYTVSVYAKAASMQWIAMLSPNGANFGAYFDLVNGVKGTEASGVTATITAVGDGWYRCSVSQVLSATTVYCGISFADANGGTTVTANGTSGVYLWGAQLSDSASLDTYVPVYGAAVTSAAYYGPRLDYDGSTLAAKGLLVEEQRTNLVLLSNEFNDGVQWGLNGTAAITAGTTVSPDGTTNASTLTGASGDPASGVTNTLYQGITVSSSTTYTASIYIRGLVGTTAKLLLRDASTGITQATTVTLTSAWQRATVSLTTGASTTGVSFRLGSTNGTVAIYGAQLEAGSFATSYIPTGSATVTRSADVAQVSTQAFPLGSTEGTIVTSATPIGFNVANFITTLQDASLNNFVQHYYQSATNLRVSVVASGGTVAEFDNAVVMGATHKVATAFKANDFASSFNGGSPQTDNTGTAPTGFTTLNIGRRSDGFTFNGHIRQITYIPRRLSNSELQSRTT